MKLAQLLYTTDCANDADNPRVPVLDVFEDTFDQDILYVVTPYLRPLDDPPFETVLDVINFVDQTLEVCPFTFELYGTVHISFAGTLLSAQARDHTWVGLI